MSSPYFKALLTGHFSEAVELRHHGTVEITLPEDDAEAMLAVMNAVHGKFWDVPGRKIKLELLKNIAVVVDKYDLFDSVCTLLHTWVSTVRVGNPRAQLHQIAQWFLCVTWVFNQGDMFRYATRELILDTGVDVDLDGTCIPATVSGEYCPLPKKRRKETNERTDRITERRARLLRNLKSLVQPLREDTYTDQTTVCSPYCDAIVRLHLEDILAMIKKGPRSRVKPITIRRMISDLYNRCMDSHHVIQNSIGQLNYRQPFCIDHLEELDWRFGQVFNRVSGLVLSRYKGNARKKLDWTGCNAGLNPKGLWPYGYRDH